MGGTAGKAGEWVIRDIVRRRTSASTKAVAEMSHHSGVAEGDTKGLALPGGQRMAEQRKDTQVMGVFCREERKRWRAHRPRKREFLAIRL